MSFSPQKLILGGGVMAKPGLLDAVIEKTTASLNNYLVLPHGKTLSDIIVTPGLGEKSGLMGALVLAKQHAMENSHGD
jgi:fructokinase